MAPAVPRIWCVPRRAIDDRVPAYSDNVGSVKPGDTDLLDDMPQPGALVQPGITTVMDGVPIMPTGFRHHDWLAIASPGRHQHLHERRPRRMRIVVDPDNIDMNCRDDRVGRLELTVAHTGDGIVCKDGDIGMMISCDAGHGDRHVDRLMPRHSSDRRVE